MNRLKRCQPLCCAVLLLIICPTIAVSYPECTKGCAENDCYKLGNHLFKYDRSHGKMLMWSPWIVNNNEHPDIDGDAQRWETTGEFHCPGKWTSTGVCNEPDPMTEPDTINPVYKCQSSGE